MAQKSRIKFVQYYKEHDGPAVCFRTRVCSKTSPEKWEWRRLDRVTPLLNGKGAGFSVLRANLLNIHVLGKYQAQNDGDHKNHSYYIGGKNRLNSLGENVPDISFAGGGKADADCQR